MPIYPFQCYNCSRKFDKSLRIDERNNPVQCPDCGSMDTMRRLGIPDIIYNAEGFTKRVEEKKDGKIEK